MKSSMTDLRSKLDKVLAGLKGDISSLRTGRATPALVEDIAVEAYGSRQPLKALAAISIPEPRQIVIQPWDKSLLPAVEKAIQSSALGINPVADKDIIRIAMPTLTEERKRDLVKLLKEKLENARIHVRRIRDEAMKAIEAEEKAKAISEDEKFRKKQETEKAVGECNKKIEETGASKEREIMAG
ncbi:MAG: ribosome recycling factor [Candidatus Sungbacteria bacterium]|uniref:Ribosome-recycling factor n=1 Tax=Candidatus Sungiibacteriota bacterium TaxID=2750080 RepID=A0A933DST5_9BACT|nr:ribosome recycling factor [Candidatus Sungbacteria bacterium]